jgi:VanZ family protein
MFLRSLLPAFIWTFVIFLLCSFPGDAIPSISWLELLSFDKWVHFGIFFLLQLLWMRGFYIQKKYSSLKRYFTLSALLICIPYGAALEMMQRFIFLSRSGDVLDFVANTVGAIMGSLLFSRFRSLLQLPTV